MSGLFTRRQQGDAGTDAEESVALQNDAAVAPPDDFKFPWTRPGAEPTTPVAQEMFRTVDDALPSPPDARIDAPEASRPSPKDGVFSRLFDLDEKNDALELEVHEDRIEAAANALDAAGQPQFESFDGKSNVADTGFRSVDEALPPVDDALPFLPTADDPSSPTGTEEKTDEYEVLEIASSAEKDVNADTQETQRKGFWSDSFIGRFFRPGETEIEQVGAKTGEAAEASAVFLFAKFRAFYHEVIRFQHQKSEFTAGFATAMMSDTADSAPDRAAEILSHRLSELLDLQAAEAKWMGGEASERYPDAQYAMAALADEIFTNSEWDGQSSWSKYSLEHRLYKSHSADVELFKRIDRLLKDSPDTASARDLARVYLLVLAAGFQGKWRPFSLTRPLSEYRRRLYEYIHNTDPLMLYAPERRVFPEAVSRTLEGHAVSRFSAAQRWAAILMLLVVTYAVVAHVAWSRASADLKDVTTRIKTSTTAGAP